MWYMDFSCYACAALINSRIGTWSVPNVNKILQSFTKSIPKHTSLQSYQINFESNYDRRALLDSYLAMIFMLMITDNKIKISITFG